MPLRDLMEDNPFIGLQFNIGCPALHEKVLQHADLAECAALLAR